jgi:SAM-dependent methyltransferase
VSTPAESARQDPAYALNRGDSETDRLIRQAQLSSTWTRRLFQDAGIGPGMKVLDVGSGAGDVAFLAAELVGPTGQVVGVDADPAVLETARRRAGEARLANVTFVAGDVRSVDLPDDFDAAIGRLVLMYLADPAEALRGAVRRVRPGGVVAFQDLDVSIMYAHANAGYHSELTRRLWSWLHDALERAGIDGAMGRHLHRTFLDAGLPAPELSLTMSMGASESWPGYDLVAATFRSLLPLLERTGVATAAELDVDTLADRLRAEAADSRLPILLTPMVGAWARR